MDEQKAGEAGALDLDGLRQKVLELAHAAADRVKRGTNGPAPSQVGELAKLVEVFDRLGGVPHEGCGIYNPPPAETKG